LLPGRWLQQADWLSINERRRASTSASISRTRCSALWRAARWKSGQLAGTRRASPSSSAPGAPAIGSVASGGGGRGTGVSPRASAGGETGNAEGALFGLVGAGGPGDTGDVAEHAKIQGNTRSAPGGRRMADETSRLSLRTFYARASHSISTERLSWLAEDFGQRRLVSLRVTARSRLRHGALDP
jgi:hypothetical protein